MATTTHPSAGLRSNAVAARRRYEELTARRRDAVETIRLCDDELGALEAAYPGIARPSRVIWLTDDDQEPF